MSEAQAPEAIKPQPAAPTVREVVRKTASANNPRTWLVPFLTLTAAALALLVLGESMDHARGLLDALRSPDAQIAPNSLGNIGQVVSQVLGVAISVVAIIVELAANRYTHRITELFFRAPTNFAVMGLFVVSGLEPLWVAFTYQSDPGARLPAAATALSVVLMSVSVLLLLPYFAYVAAFVNPMNVINRIRTETFGVVQRGPRSEGSAEVDRVHHVAIDGAEQIADVALNAMVNHDKAISMTAVNALGDLLRDYLEVKPRLPKAWFQLSNEVRTNPDFVSLADVALAEIEKERNWFEFKLMRQYEMIYRDALNENREICYLITINVRELAEAAMAAGDRRVVDLAIKFFNTFLRATINARDVRTAYNVLNQYRLLAETSLKRREGRVAVAVAKYFKYYGQIAFHMDIGFILETAAYDLCTLNELAFDLESRERAELLRVFLQVDKEGEGARQETALRGVRKAQVKLAAYYLLRGDTSAARQVYKDMANEQASRLASIRDELLAVESPYFWEVTDRGTNFDWMPPERRGRLMDFFEWFGDQLPPPRVSVVPGAPSAPVPINATSTSNLPALSPEEAAAIVSDPGAAPLVSSPNLAAAAPLVSSPNLTAPGAGDGAASPVPGREGALK